MKKKLFKGLAKLNKIVLPSFTKKHLDLEKANKFQLMVMGWKLWVTKNAVDQ